MSNKAKPYNRTPIEGLALTVEEHAGRTLAVLTVVPADGKDLDANALRLLASACYDVAAELDGRNNHEPCTCPWCPR